MAKVPADAEHDSVHVLREVAMTALDYEPLRWVNIVNGRPVMVDPECICPILLQLSQGSPSQNKHRVPLPSVHR